MTLTNSIHQSVQFRDSLINATLSGIQYGNLTNLIQCLICLLFLLKIREVVSQLCFHTNCCIEHLHLILEETFNVLYVILIIKEAAFLLQKSVNQSCIILTLRKHAFH